MKINQLFNNTMEDEVLLSLLSCYGLKNLDDKKAFRKQDLVSRKTVEKINDIKHTLAQYYLPCKAKLYLDCMTEKKAITVLRQVIRLYGHHITSKEKNISNKKIIFYTLDRDDNGEGVANMKTQHDAKILYFN
jgi:hypothetical protein